MKDIEGWSPTKFVKKDGSLRASSEHVGVGSRLIAGLVAAYYEALLPRYAQGKLLDLGCGYVPLYEAYRDLVTENICVDWKGSLHQNTHLDIQHDLTQPLPLSEEEFDTIVLSDVLEHIPTPERLWSEMARVLAPDGKIILNVPFLYWLHEAPHDYFRYTEYALRRFVKEAGLDLVYLSSIGGGFEVIVDILSKKLGSKRGLGKPLVVALQKFALWRTLRRTDFQENRSDGMPLGYMLIARKAAPSKDKGSPVVDFA